MLSLADNTLSYSLDFVITLISQKLFHSAICELWRVIGISFPFFWEMGSQAKAIDWQIQKFQGSVSIHLPMLKG